MSSAWNNLPPTVKEQTRTLARAGAAHPDPAVRTALVGWHRSRYRRAKVYGWVTIAMGLGAIGFVAAALATNGVMMSAVGLLLAFGTLLLDGVALHLHRRTQAYGWLIAPNLAPPVEEVALPLTVRSATRHAPMSLPTIVTVAAMLASMAACTPFLEDLPKAVSYVLFGFLGLFLVIVLFFASGTAQGRPLIVMDEHRLDLPALKVTLMWDEVEAVGLTAARVMGWGVGHPMGFAVLPRTPAGPRVVQAVMRRQQGWLFYVDWQMDTPPEIVVATALRLRAASRRTPAAEPAP